MLEVVEEAQEGTVYEKGQKKTSKKGVSARV